MRSQRIVGILIGIGILVGLSYFFLYKKPAIIAAGGGDDPDLGGIEMKTIRGGGNILGIRQHDAAFHERMSVFERRAVEFRKQTVKFTTSEALPRGLKDNIYAFTEDVRELDPAQADKYYAEFCEGRLEYEPRGARRSRTRSHTPQRAVSEIGLSSTAPLNTSMRDNKDSMFSLEPGQFNIKHEGGKRGLDNLSLHLGISRSASYNSAPDVKRNKRNPLSYQEATVTSATNSGFDVAPSHNNRDEDGTAETSLSGNKRKLRDPPAKLNPLVKGAKAILSTHDAFNAFHALNSDNKVPPPTRAKVAKTATGAIILRRTVPAIPQPQFNAVSIPANVLASDDIDKTTTHDYMNSLDLCLVSLGENFTEAKAGEAEALIGLIELDPSVNTMQYTMQLAQIRNRAGKKGRDIRNVYGAIELENQEKARKKRRTPLPSRSGTPGYSVFSSVSSDPPVREPTSRSGSGLSSIGRDFGSSVSSGMLDLTGGGL